MWGFIICATQAAALEHAGMRTATWSGFNGILLCLRNLLHDLPVSLIRSTVGLLVAYTCGKAVTFDGVHPLADVLILAMIILYTVAPLLYRLASSAYFNLSLLSSDFYGLLFGTSYPFASALLLLMQNVIFRVVPLRGCIPATIIRRSD
jgi:solute carrier family 35 protein F1/2